MSAFHEIRFPFAIGLGASGGLGAPSVYNQNS